MPGQGVESGDMQFAVVALIASRCGLPPEAIDPVTSTIEDIGLDSLDAADLLVSLEQMTGLQFELPPVSATQTVQELIDGLLATGASLPAQ